MSEMTACIRAEIWRMRNNQRFFEANTVQEETDALEEQIATLTEERDAARTALNAARGGILEAARVLNHINSHLASIRVTVGTTCFKLGETMPTASRGTTDGGGS